MRRTFQLVATGMVSACLLASAAEAQTLDEVIAKNLEAKGGLETLKATNTVKMTGRFTTQGIEMPMTTWAKRPNMVRREAEVAPRGTSAGQRLPVEKRVSASDGKTVWVMIGASPAQEVPSAQAEGVRSDAEFDSIFIDYKQKGHRVELVGNYIEGGKAHHHLKVTRKDGPVQHYYLDATTGLEAKIVTDVNQNGMKLTVEMELSDYRKVEGRMVPFRTKQSTNGTTAAEMSIESIEFNVPLDDSLFRMPSGK